MERFCSDIKLEPEDIAMLCIAFKMQAKNMGYFTQTEWLRGLSDPEVQIDSAGKLQNKINYFYDLLNDPVSFKLIFRYVSFVASRAAEEKKVSTLNAFSPFLGLRLCT